MSLGRLQNEGDLTRFIAAHLERPENRKAIISGTDEVEPMQLPALETGWTDATGGYEGAGYYRDRRRVYLRGSVESDGSGSGLLFTLPEGYRPAGTLTFRVDIFGGSGPVEVAADGAVTDLTFDANSQAYLSFGAINFRAEDA